MSISKKTVKGVMIYSLLYYIFSIGVYFSIINLMHEVESIKMSSITTIDSCLDLSDKLIKKCNIRNERKQEILNNGFSEKINNAAFTTKPFYLYSKSDSKSDADIFIDFFIEQLNQSKPLTNDEIRHKEDTITSLKDIKKEIHDILDETWLMLYFLLNPLIPIVFVSFQYYVGYLAKKAYRYFSNKNKKG